MSHENGVYTLGCIVNSFEDKLKGMDKLLYIKDDETCSSE